MIRPTCEECVNHQQRSNDGPAAFAFFSVGATVVPSPKNHNLRCSSAHCMLQSFIDKPRSYVSHASVGFLFLDRLAIIALQILEDLIPSE